MQNKKFLVAVSGGPDSMALLDTCRNQEDELIVAHVNYAMRDTAKRDQEIVEKYCKENNIKCIVDNTFIHRPCQNFQSQARVHRYEFFKKICVEHKLEGVYVGHHQDDALETYLFQEKRGSLVDFHGLAFETEVSNTKIIRPLLNATKKQILEYLEENKINFGIDESNFDPKYQRFAFRKQVQELSYDERYDLILEMHDKNKLLMDMKKAVDDAMATYFKNNMLDLEAFKTTINEVVLRRTLFKFLSAAGYPEELILGTTISEIISFVNKSTQGNSSMDGKAGYKIQLNKKRLEVKHPQS